MSRPTQLDYLRLRSRSDAALANVTRTYATTGKGADWFGKRAADVLVQQHAKAVALGRGLAGGTRAITADRQAARSVVFGKDGEAQFLKGFVADLKAGKFTDEDGNPRVKAIQYRLGLYSRKLAGTANQAFVDLSPESESFAWVLGDGEHCADCVALAAGSPYDGHELPTTPGSSDTACFQPVQVRFDSERRGAGIYYRLKKPKLWDIVQIDWLDSMHTTGWLHWKDHDWNHEVNTLVHKSCGYVAQITEQSISLVQSFNDQWKDGNPALVDAVMTIPRCSITAMTVLARKRK